MNEHWNIEVVFVEHARNVTQMPANLVPRGIVLIGPNIDFDDPAVWKKRKVMCRGFVGKSHRVIATILDACRVITGLLMLIVHGAFHGRLGLCPYGQAKGGDENERFHLKFLSMVGWGQQLAPNVRNPRVRHVYQGASVRDVCAKHSRSR
jgi:hypothetical protein